MIELTNINIRAEPPEVNQGTSLNSRVSVQSFPRIALLSLNEGFVPNSVINHSSFSAFVKEPSIRRLMVSSIIFLVAGISRLTGRIDATFICCSGASF
jgi:hypothetical protein